MSMKLMLESSKKVLSDDAVTAFQTVSGAFRSKKRNRIPKIKQQSLMNYMLEQGI